ncbi:hypothetical protein MPH_12564 [Macrophomina phaseolina MS6]|uniref:Uncharacterized protein n=1 Tax=Macrophomina phaseolina (strain MS6) TaxID=1126212 RepID=K2RJH7_MACPH|nr:hypothetical protein MPH_12564 [Macrophomina phaseolina MS6]
MDIPALYAALAEPTHLVCLGPAETPRCRIKPTASAPRSRKAARSRKSTRLAPSVLSHELFIPPTSLASSSHSSDNNADNKQHAREAGVHTGRPLLSPRRGEGGGPNTTPTARRPLGARGGISQAILLRTILPTGSHLRSLLLERLLCRPGHFLLHQRAMPRGPPATRPLLHLGRIPRRPRTHPLRAAHLHWQLEVQLHDRLALPLQLDQHHRAAVCWQPSRDPRPRPGLEAPAQRLQVPSLRRGGDSLPADRPGRQ